MITIKTYNRIYKAFNEPEPTNYVCLKNEHPSSAANFVTDTKMSSPINLEYSLDNKTWNNYDMTNKPTISVPAGDYIYLRGVNTGVEFGHNLHFKFGLDKKFSTGGDIRTLLNHQDVNSVTKIPYYAFYECFKNDINITSCTWDMSGITEVGLGGFESCFYGCSALTTAPNFSNVTSVDDYGFEFCFQECSALTTAPNFSNVTSVGESGFNFCFYKCTKLTTPPDFSKVTSVDSGGFFFCFNGCSSLTTPPEFPNLTTVSEHGFNACFCDCTSLTTAPDFSKVTSVSDNGFFYCFSGCTSLTTAPDFSKVRSVGDHGFYYCFEGCTSLNLVTAPYITHWIPEKFSEWLKNVASSGVVRKPAILTIPTDITSGVPRGWRTENY